MLWFLLVALAIAGGHWITALLYAALALASQPKRQAAVIVRAQAPEPPPTPYDLAVARRRGRQLRLVQGGGVYREPRT